MKSNQFQQSQRTQSELPLNPEPLSNRPLSPAKKDKLADGLIDRSRETGIADPALLQYVRFGTCRKVRLRILKASTELPTDASVALLAAALKHTDVTVASMAAGHCALSRSIQSLFSPPPKQLMSRGYAEIRLLLADKILYQDPPFGSKSTKTKCKLREQMGTSAWIALHGIACPAVEKAALIALTKAGRVKPNQNCDAIDLLALRERSFISPGLKNHTIEKIVALFRDPWRDEQVLVRIGRRLDGAIFRIASSESHLRGRIKGHLISYLKDPTNRGKDPLGKIAALYLLRNFNRDEDVIRTFNDVRSRETQDIALFASLCADPLAISGLRELHTRLLHSESSADRIIAYTALAWPIHPELDLKLERTLTEYSKRIFSKIPEESLLGFERSEIHKFLRLFSIRTFSDFEGTGLWSAELRSGLTGRSISGLKLSAKVLLDLKSIGNPPPLWLLADAELRGSAINALTGGQRRLASELGGADDSSLSEAAQYLIDSFHQIFTKEAVSQASLNAESSKGIGAR